MKIFFRTIHLYLSLAAGLVIAIACLTGAILVFEKELEELFHPDRYQVQNIGNRVALDQLVSNVQKKRPGSTVVGAKVYSNPKKTVEINLIEGQKNAAEENVTIGNEKRTGRKEKAQGGGTTRPSHTAFVNPYNGNVIEVYSAKGSFFQKTMALHRWLLGKNDGIGKYIVGISTFIFLFILITGIILWWPKTRNIFLQRINIKWDGSWKRLNHDLHLVFGFYSAIFLFIFAFTAMSWSFKWFNKGIYTITNTTPETPQPPTSIYKKGRLPISFDQVYQLAQAHSPGSVYYNLRAPKDSLGIFSVTTLDQNVAEMRTDILYFDQYTGKIAGSLKYADKNLGQKIRATIKPIHVSSVWGLPSKIIGFIVCLLGVTFPVTGIIMWLNRLKLSKKLTKKSL